jgi:hypothetical protein
VRHRSSGRGCGCFAGACRLDPGLFKDTYNLGFKLHKLHEHDVAPWMEDEIETFRQEIDVPTESLTHAALDAVALMGFAKHLADGEADARSALRRGTCAISDLRRQKPAHVGRLTLSAGCVCTKEVGMLAQTRARQRLALAGLGR